MTNEEALTLVLHGKYAEADEAIIAALEKQMADGCQGCAFMDTEEWEMPCAKCKRNCKDYWRRPA